MNIHTSPTLGMVARWKPVHLGHLAVLRALCTHAEHAKIGIGSSNIYDYRNPFTLEETTAMLTLALEGFSNYTLYPVPDLFNGPKWRVQLLETFGRLDVFLTENPYVAHLMGNDYEIAHPVTIVPEEERVRLNGTMVRLAMARGEAWAHLVPPAIAAYLKENQLDTRFRREFGLQTLAMETVIDSSSHEKGA